MVQETAKKLAPISGPEPVFPAIVVADVPKEVFVFVRSANNYDVDYASDVSGLVCDPEENMTLQSFADECDINKIVENFGLTGQLPEVVRVPKYGDFTDVMDFQTAMNALRTAQEGFNELPADLRYKFANDPQRLLEFMADDANRDEAIKLGLVNPEVVPPRDVVTAVDDLGKLLTPRVEGK